MRGKIFVSSVMVGSMLIAGSLRADPITFDDVPTGHLSDGYQSVGVLFSTVSYNSATNVIIPVADHVLVVDDPNVAVSDPNYIRAVASSTDDSASSTNDILMRFVLPGTDDAALTNSVTISLDQVDGLAGDPRDDAVMLFVFGANGRILAVDVAFDTELRQLTITTNSNQIARAVIAFSAAPGSTDFEGFDAVSAGPLVLIPEPASGLLGLAGIAMMAKRRRQSKASV
jgi:hypothetical protein